MCRGRSFAVRLQLPAPDRGQLPALPGRRRTAYRGAVTVRGKGTKMFTLQISYPVRDYGAWKKVFDSDPAGRAASGARSVRVFRDTEDQNSVAVLLDFDTKDAATVFLERLRSQVWDKPEVI